MRSPPLRALRRARVNSASRLAALARTLTSHTAINIAREAAHWISSSYFAAHGLLPPTLSSFASPLELEPDPDHPADEAAQAAWADELVSDRLDALATAARAHMTEVRG